MTLPGECVNETQTVCMECGKTIDLRFFAVLPAITSAFSAPSAVPTAVKAAISTAGMKRKRPSTWAISVASNSISITFNQGLAGFGWAFFVH